MSIKYNRNDANADDDKFYLDDYKVDLNSVEQDLLDVLLNFQKLPVVISGLGVTPADYPSTDIYVAAGSARDKDGKPVNIATQQTVQMTDTGGGNNYVILKHKYSTDTPRQAYETGVEYNTRKYDDFELEVASSYSAGDIVLDNVKREGSANVLYTNERTPRPVKFSGDNLQFVGAGSGHETIQQAVDAASTGVFTLIALLPGNYDAPVDVKNKTIGILGLGKVIIGPNQGRIYSSGSESNLLSLKNVIVQCDGGTFQDMVSINHILGEKIFIDNVNIIATGTNTKCGLHIQGKCNPNISGLRIRVQTGYGVKFTTTEGNIIKAEITGHGIQCSENPIKLDSPGGDSLWLHLWNTVLKSGTDKFSVAGTNNERVIMGNCRYNENPDSDHLILDFGVLHNISNLKFDAGDLEVLP